MSEPPWLRVARKYLGVREIKGPKHNSKILAFWDRIRVRITNDETPWCAAGIGGWLEEAGYKSTRSGLALSYARYGFPMSYPAVGSIAYKNRYNSAGKVVGGHVFIVVGQRSNGDIVGIGANQGDAVSIASFRERDILGYRWPTGDLPPRVALPLYSKAFTPLSES